MVRCPHTLSIYCMITYCIITKTKKNKHTSSHVKSKGQERDYDDRDKTLPGAQTKKSKLTHRVFFTLFLVPIGGSLTPLLNSCGI